MLIIILFISFSIIAKSFWRISISPSFSRITLSEIFLLSLLSDISFFKISNSPSSLFSNFISDAPSSNISLQGKSFFYVVENNDIKLGSKIKADITKINNQVKRKKLFIPSESVVWSSGKPWVFIKKDGDENIFLRKPLINPLETENGWIILEDNLKNNELVVVDGAQLLLSEEFKYQIKNENED